MLFSGSKYTYMSVVMSSLVMEDASKKRKSDNKPTNESKDWLCQKKYKTNEYN